MRIKDRIMKKRFIAVFFAALLIIGILLVAGRALSEFFSSPEKNNGSFELQNLVAHGAGRVNGIFASNSQEALTASYNKGFRFIELDFEWTNDGYLVLIHDWGDSIVRLFNKLKKPKYNYSLSEYKKLKMISGLTQMTLDDLAEWVCRHKDTFIITDIKRYNILGLKTISKQFPELIDNFIPQIYYFEEYPAVKKLGYEHIILTLYVAKYADEDVLDFALNNSLSAVTMPVYRARTDLPPKLKKIGIPAYAHTINSPLIQKQLYVNGIFGIYTDSLSPKENGSLITDE